MKVQALATGRYMSFALTHPSMAAKGIWAGAAASPALQKVGKGLVFAAKHPIQAVNKIGLAMKGLTFAKIALGLKGVWAAVSGIAVIGPILTAIGSAAAGRRVCYYSPFCSHRVSSCFYRDIND